MVLYWVLLSTVVRATSVMTVLTMYLLADQSPRAARGYERPVVRWHAHGIARYVTGLQQGEQCGRERALGRRVSRRR